jgi:membrane protease YdiL (CAAX protease family)
LPRSVHPGDPISEQQAVAPMLEEAPPLIEVLPSAPVQNPSDAVVDLFDVALVLLVSAAAFFFVGFAAVTVFMLTHRSQGLNSKAMEDAFTHNAFFIVPVQLVVYVAIVGCMALLVWGRHKTSLFQAIRWNAPDGLRASIAVIVGAALALVSDIGEVVLHPWIPKSLPITEYFRDRPSALLLAAFAVLVAPIMEEIVFRGFLFPGLARWLGAVPSILITASAFTLLHGSQLGYSWAPLLLIFVVGMVLTVTRVVTKSVATCVIIHMAYNFALMAQSFIFTHGFRQMQGD